MARSVDAGFRTCGRVRPDKRGLRLRGRSTEPRKGRLRIGKVRVLRQTVVYLLIGVALFFGWKNLSRAAQETVVLRTSTLNGQDHYATLWVVDDHPYVWIRAEDRRRRWLGAVQANPNVELRRGTQTRQYQATLFDTPEARAYVDAMFREKYGLADRVRASLVHRDTLPIRLDPR